MRSARISPVPCFFVNCETTEHAESQNTAVQRAQIITNDELLLMSPQAETVPNTARLVVICGNVQIQSSGETLLSI